MKRIPSRSGLVAVSLLCAMLLAACSSGGPILRSVTIAPATASIDASGNGANNTQAYTATGFYSDGTQKDVTAQTSWASSNSGVASIDSTGLATAGNPPDTTSVTITGSIGGSAAIATLTVFHPVQSLTISTTTPSIALGLTAQYKATAIYANLGGTNHSEDVTKIATWNSGTPGTATIDSSGLATSVAVGTTNITATLNTIPSNTAVLTVTPAVTTGLKVTPGTPSLALGNSVNLVAVELLTNGKTQTPTGPVTWATSACTPAGAVIIGSTVTNGTEAVGGAAVGSCTATATEGALQGTATVTVVTGSAHFAYVADSSGAVSGYAVTASAATPFVALTPATTAATQPQQAIVHPNGQFLYTIDGASKVHVYTISGAGALTLPTEPNPLPTMGSGDIDTGAIDPTGRFLFVVDNLGATVDSATIDPVTGLLGSVSSHTDGNITGPENVVVDHQGKFLYVTDDGGNVLGYSINQSNGTLTALSTPAYATGVGPLGLAIDPSNKYLYVANSDDTVSFFSINNSTGILTSGASLTIAGAAFLSNVVVDPSGKYLYILDSGASTGAVYAYNLGTNGVIGPQIGTSPVATGASPFGIAIDPTGTLLAVDNNSSDTISLFKVAAGVLTAETPATIATGSQPLYVTFLNAP